MERVIRTEKTEPLRRLGQREPEPQHRAERMKNTDPGRRAEQMENQNRSIGRNG